MRIIFERLASSNLIMRRITFNRPFYVLPHVFVGLTGFDITKGYNWRCHLFITNINTRSFDLNIRSWEGQNVEPKLHRASASWIASPSTMQNVEVGTMCGSSSNGIWKGSNRFSRFRKTPVIFTALTKFDVNAKLVGILEYVLKQMRMSGASSGKSSHGETPSCGKYKERILQLMRKLPKFLTKNKIAINLLKYSDYRRLLCS
jgi:hypothetical protein